MPTWRPTGSDEITATIPGSAISDGSTNGTSGPGIALSDHSGSGPSILSAPVQPYRSAGGATYGRYSKSYAHHSPSTPNVSIEVSNSSPDSGEREMARIGTASMYCL